MRRLFAIASTAKRFVRRNLQGKGNPRTAPSTFDLCWGRRDFSGHSYDYREKLRNGLSDIKLDDAVDLFSEMVKSRPFPSIIEFSKLLSGIAKMNKLDAVISMGEQMQKAGDFTQISDVVALVDQIVELGYHQPNTVTFNTLIHGLFLHNKASEAVALVDRMAEKGCLPNLVTYGTVVNGLCKRGDIDLALHLLKNMEQGKIEADVVIYNTVIDGLCKYKHVNDALNLFNKMESKGVRATVVTYSSLISCLSNYGKSSDASRLLSDMIEKKINLNVVTFSALIDAFGKDGETFRG
ncbi:PREDICTED: pentatricopeptide repeat-containing protein At1g62590-like [Camelina sativa]|uniref:Pentatricopeptide repeat-containing protein At1g62590-like n=1 Tax=Camelina sativa TaxID=90675 RepID=A0ABM0XEN5_CAMSA|nr:PREDICTED: pentatricopeptide repeat-containing protein At1g62590-like [Camelina sativa]